MHVRSFVLLISVLLLPPIGATSDGKLNWMVGCWVSPDRSAQEVWVADDSSYLIGFSTTVNDGAVGFYEVMTIKNHRSGEWTFTAHPARQVRASFQAIEFGDQSVVFANPNHDYPQEIRYRREDQTLYASISLLDGKQPTSFDKTACA